MSETGEKSIYEVAVEEGAKSISKKTGKSIEEVLKEARQANQKDISEAGTSSFSGEEVKQSQKVHDKAFKRAQNKNKGS